jgi:hypothetical protein
MNYIYELYILINTLYYLHLGHHIQQTQLQSKLNEGISPSRSSYRYKMAVWK